MKIKLYKLKYTSNKKTKNENNNIINIIEFQTLGKNEIINQEKINDYNINFEINEYKNYITNKYKNYKLILSKQKYNKLFLLFKKANKENKSLINIQNLELNLINIKNNLYKILLKTNSGNINKIFDSNNDKNASILKIKVYNKNNILIDKIKKINIENFKSFNLYNFFSVISIENNGKINNKNKDFIIKIEKDNNLTNNNVINTLLKISNY